MKRTLVGVLAALAMFMLSQGEAFAGTVGATRLDLTGAYLRAYQNTADTRAGHDGWCYPGQDNPGDWACSVDTSTTRGSFSFIHVTYAINGRNGIFVQQRYKGQAPYCLPQWAAEHTAYHAATSNIYLCGYQN